MGMNCSTFALFSTKLNEEIIKNILETGKIIGLSYRMQEIEPNVYAPWDLSELAHCVYQKTLVYNKQVYSSVFGSSEGKSFALQFASSGQTNYTLEDNEFEIRLEGYCSLFAKYFRGHDEGELRDIGRYTQIVLDITKDLPIKQIFTELR